MISTENNNIQNLLGLKHSLPLPLSLTRSLPFPLSPHPPARCLSPSARSLPLPVSPGFCFCFFLFFIASTILCQRCSVGLSRIGQEFNLKCVFVLIFSLSVFLLTYFGFFLFTHRFLGLMQNTQSSTVNAIPMSKQLEYFKQYKAKLQKKIGKKRVADQIKKALFYVNAGSDDFAFSYFGDGLNQTVRYQTYKLPDYEQFVLQLMQQFIQGLSDQVTGLPPLGCIPIVITLLPRPKASPQRNCVDYQNSFVRDFNSLLQNQLKSMQSKLSKFGTKIAYIDFEQPLLDVIQNPNKYGFTKVNKGCCGTGLYEIGGKCNQTTPVCADTSKYVFWDAAHPTEKTYGIIFASNIPTILGLIKD